MLKNRKKRIIIVISLVIIILFLKRNEVFGVDVIGKFTNGVAGVFLFIAKAGLVLIGEAIKAILSFFSGKEAITVQDILFNEVPITDINFFDFNSTDSTVAAIRENVAAWYIGIRNLAAVLLVIVALYVGLRMAISTIAEDRAKYKQMLIDWVTSICILFFLHYIMVIIIQVNNTLVKTIGDQKNLKQQNMDDIAIKFRDYALTGKNFFKNNSSNSGGSDGFASTFAAAVIYLGIEMMTIIFLLTYIRRMITIGFLIIIAPLVTVTYSIDKMGDGRSQALNMWIKEFTYNILIQPFQCVTYLALCSTSFEILQRDPDFKSAVIAIAMMIFLVKSEGIIKHIFHFQSSSMADTVADAAILTSMLGAGRKMFGESGKSDSSSGGRVPRRRDDGPLPEGNGGGNLGPVNINDGGASGGGDSGAVPPSRGGDGDGSPSSPDNGSGGGSGTPSPNSSNPQSGPRNGPRNAPSGNRGGKPGVVARDIATKATGLFIRANATALGLGIGLAAGGATGDLKTALTTSMQMTDAIGGYGKKIAGNTQTSHYKKEVARAFENYRAYKESLGEHLTEEQIGREGMELLFGEREAKTEEERAYRDALLNMQNNYLKNGKDEKDSIKEVQKVIEGVESGEITEQWAAIRYIQQGGKKMGDFIARNSKSKGTKLSGRGTRNNSGEGGSSFRDGASSNSSGGSPQGTPGGVPTPTREGEDGSRGHRDSGGSSGETSNRRGGNNDNDSGSQPTPTPTPMPTGNPPMPDEDHSAQPRNQSDSSDTSRSSHSSEGSGASRDSHPSEDSARNNEDNTGSGEGDN